MAGLQGRVFGGYQLAEQLPSGGIAEVYRAHPAKPGGREAVVKIIYPEFARQPGFIPHFRQIVQVSSKLVNHPHILPLLANGEENGYLYLVTPYVAAGTLRDRMQKGGRLGATDVAPFFRQLCDALSYAHSLGVIHGNMKPSNVFLFEGRHVMLGDFGMLWDVSHMDMNHAGSGTDAVEYLAPEVANGQVTQLSDVYSVGALLFASITGQAPFRGAKPADVFAAHAQAPVPQLAQVAPQQPPAVLALDAIIQRAMAKRPDDRYPSAAAIAQAVETAVRQAPAAAPDMASRALGLAPLGSSPLAYLGQAGIAGAGAAMPFGPTSMPGLQSPGLIPPALGSMGLGMPGMQPLASGSQQLRPLDPPFPPLPPSAQIDEHMEQGRIPGGTIPTMRVPAPPVPLPQGNPAIQDAFSQSTMHMPSPAFTAGALVDNAAWPDLDTGMQSILGGGPGLPQQAPPGGDPSEMPAIQPNRGPIPRLRSGLAQRLGARSGGPATGASDEDDLHLPAMPAMTGDIAPPPGAMPVSPPANFRVAGGNGGQAAQAAPTPFEGAGSPPAPPSAGNEPLVEEGRTGEFGVYRVGGGWAGGYTDEHAAMSSPSEAGGHSFGAEFGGGSRDSSGSGGWERSAHGDPPAVAMDGRPFSPTRLGLPSLTSPALRDLPPSWQDVVGDRAPTVNQDRTRDRRPEPRHAERDPFDVSAFDGGSSGAWSASGEKPWAESRANWSPEESGDWSAAGPAVSTWEESAILSAQIAADQSGEGAEKGKRGKNGKNGKAPRVAIVHDDFEDERVWTKGMTAVKPRGRLLRRIALFAVLLLIFDMCGLIIARPDLCPNGTCRILSTQVHETLPFLHTWNPSGVPPLSTTPQLATIDAVIGKPTTATLAVSNTGVETLTWQASTGLPWLTVAPTTATLKPGENLQLTITAHPVGIKAATYSSTAALVVGDTALMIPVNIKVTVGPQLAVSPASLNYSYCATTKTVTISNPGDSALTFNAAPSQSDALTLSAKSGTVAPGASSTLRVTLTCQASVGSYSVNLTSNGGSATIAIQYS